MGCSGGMSERLEEGIMTGLQFIQDPHGLQVEIVLHPTGPGLNAVV